MKQFIHLTNHPQKLLLFTSILITIISCASLGSKTIYHADNISILKPTKILLIMPTLINPDENAGKTFETLKQQLSLELAPFEITFEKTNDSFQNFEEINPDETIKSETKYDADFLLFTKLIRLTAMQQTRDYKVEYKLVSLTDCKLKFYSKYNTTLGSTVVVVPGIKEYPTSEHIMIMAIRSGLHEFKKKLLQK